MGIQSSRYVGDIVHEYTVNSDGMKKAGYPVRRRFNVKAEVTQDFLIPVEEMQYYQISYYLFGVTDYWWLFPLVNVAYWDLFNLPTGKNVRIPSLKKSKKVFFV